MRDTVVHRMRAEVVRAAARSVDWASFAAEAIRAVRRAVGSDAWCIAPADPATLLMTGVTGEGEVGPPARFFQLEYGVADYIEQADLAGQRPHVGVLSRATDGKMQRSTRWRECLEPYGLDDQLRAALVSRGSCWGFMSLHRERGGRPFDASDARMLAGVSRALGDGLRQAMLAARATTPAPTTTAACAADSPGLIVLDDRFCVAAVTPSVAHLLGDVVITVGEPAPAELLALAARVTAKHHRAAEDARDGAGTQRMTTKPRGAPTWLTLYASLLPDAASAGGVAVIVERARPAELAGVIVRAYGFTPREADVARLVIAGRSTDEVATALFIAPLTVQQHLKAIFDKVGVRSRRELVATIFREHYLPDLHAVAPKPTELGDGRRS